MSGRKDRIDLFGGSMLVGFSVLLGFNQFLVKIVNGGMNPVFQAGMRSLCAIPPVLLYMAWRGRRFRLSDGALLAGVICGVLFAFEFTLLFLALDRTTVARASILFYTMPVWVAVAAHFLIPGERMTPTRAAGLILAVAGVAIALARNEHPASDQALLGDLMALVAATGWAAIAIIARTSRLSTVTPDMQLLYQLVVSAPILLALAPAAGPLFREMTPALWAIFTFQVLGVVVAGFMMWFWILSIYPASDMASYAFLSPVFGVIFGMKFLGETLTASVLASLVLVGAGIWLVNRRKKPVSL
ncbi:MAG: DMT family transporter [Rhizobiaceae bacterium]